MALFDSERLLFRELTEDDAENMLRIWNDPDFVRFVGDRGLHTAEQASAYLVAGPMQAYRLVGYHSFALHEKLVDADGEGAVTVRAGAFVGAAGLIRRDDGATDVGYALLPEYRGRGYAREAAIACIDRARSVYLLDKVLGLVNPANARSISVLEAAGLTFESVREAGKTHVYSIDLMR